MKTRGIIFDFDNTIVNTNCTKEDRDAGNWAEAMKKVVCYEIQPNIRNLFKSLKKRGIKICVVSSSPDRYCKVALEHLGLDVDYIIGFHDTPFRQKPDPEPIELAKCLMGHPDEVVGVGDEENDVKAYLSAGIQAINYFEYSKYYAEHQGVVNCCDSEELELAVREWAVGKKPFGPQR